LLLKLVLGVKALESLGNTTQFAICAKVKVVCWWLNRPEGVPGAVAAARMKKLNRLIAARIVTERVGRMFIGLGFLGKFETARD